jgi:ABC-type nitrate/sulfonate/bicarbonate transport system substrate-binding protein
MKKAILFLSLILIVLILVAGAYWVKMNKPDLEQKQPISPSKIILTYSFAKANQLPVIVAREKGFFKENNVEVEINQVATNATSVLASGKADVLLATPNIALPAVIEGSGLSWVGTINNDQHFVVVSTKNIKDIKTAGVIAGPGRAQTVGLLEFLGADIKNIQYQVVAGNQERLLALQQKQVDVIHTPKADWLNFKRKADLSDEYGILLDSSDEKKVQTPIGIIVRNEFLNNNKGTVESFVKALLEADSWINNKSNQEEFVRLLEKNFSDVPKEDILVEAESFTSTLEGLEFTPNLEKGKEMLKLVEASNPKAKDYDLGSFINTEISTSLKNSGFLSQLGFN